MSENLSAAAQAMNVPESLVQRSADARAKASGTDADAVLEAWAGGEGVATAAAPAAEPEPAAEAPAEPEPAAPEPQPAAAQPEPVPAAPAPAQVAVAVIERAPEEKAVVAAPVSDRIAVASRVGAVAGLLLSVVGWVFASLFLVSNADMIGEDENLAAAFGVQPGRMIVISLLISIAIGIIVAGVSRLIPAWTSPGRRLVGSPIPSVAVGVLIGGLVGALLGALMLGLGEPPDLPEDPTAIPALASVVWGMLFWIAGGWLIGALVQTLGTPEGVEPIDMEQVRTVKSRLVSAFGLPLVALVTILVLVLSFAFVFLSFPSWSPLTGTVIAGSILGFAALSASKPNMKVGLSELMVAAAGIGVVVVLIYGVLQTTGAGHHEEEETEEEAGVTEQTTDEDLPGDGVVEEPAEGDALVVHLF